MSPHASMRLSSLSKLISGEMKATEFVSEIRGELAEHSRLLEKRGALPPFSSLKIRDSFWIA